MANLPQPMKDYALGMDRPDYIGADESKETPTTDVKKPTDFKARLKAIFAKKKAKG